MAFTFLRLQNAEARLEVADNSLLNQTKYFVVTYDK
jgi:hypothetical protein